MGRLARPANIAGSHFPQSRLLVCVDWDNEARESCVSRPETETAAAMASHGPRVLQAIWNLVSSAEDAQDVFQETFLQHHLAVSRGRAIADPAAWLCTTARHAAFRLRRRKHSGSRRVPDDLLADQPAPTPDPHHQLMLERLRDLVARLPERQAQVVALRNVEQLSFAEIATQLGISEDAARASAYKGLRRLRAQLATAKERDHVG